LIDVHNEINLGKFSHTSYHCYKTNENQMQMFNIFITEFKEIFPISGLPQTVL